MCDNNTLKDLITLGAYTGCHIEELCSLKLINVYSDKVEIVDAKTEAGWRTVPLHRHIAQMVARLVHTSSNEYLLSELTLNKYGNRSNAIDKKFGRHKKQLGYGEDHVFHSLRKGFAAQLENANVPVTVVARLMGHEIEGQTFGNYSDGLALDGLKEAINYVDWAKLTPALKPVRKSALVFRSSHTLMNCCHTSSGHIAHLCGVGL